MNIVKRVRALKASCVVPDDKDISKDACLAEKWTSIDVPTLTAIRDVPISVLFRANAIGLDDCLWLSSSYGTHSGNVVNRLDIYGLNGRRIKSIPTEAHVTLMQVLPRGKVLVDDKTEVKLVSWAGGKVSVQVVHERLSSDPKVWRGLHHVSRGCIYDEDQVITGKNTLTLFDDQEGRPVPMNINVQLLKGLYTLHTKAY